MTAEKHKVLGEPGVTPRPGVRQSLYPCHDPKPRERQLPLTPAAVEHGDVATPDLRNITL